jgi:S-methylmethionine-dependent homocysteine/selenocysteine methylase
VKTSFPPQRSGLLYLTEGGPETEVMYKHGFELPEFAMFPLLDDPAGVARLREMYRAVLDVAVEQACGVVLGGLDYRASPDWADLVGFAPEALAEVQVRAIDFLREVAEPYRSRLPALYYAGIVGPRGDAYSRNETITAESAEEYHAVQMANLVRAGVDLAEAMTFNGVPEAVGVARAGAAAGLPVSISFTLDATHRLQSGPTLREAVLAVDELAGAARPAFYGINCSHPLEFLPAIEPGEWFERVRCLRPNAASMDKVSLCSLGHLESGDPVDLGRRMAEIATRHPHLDILGGCCGTWDEHVGEIARSVQAARRAAR